MLHCEPDECLFQMYCVSFRQLSKFVFQKPKGMSTCATLIEIRPFIFDQISIINTPNWAKIFDSLRNGLENEFDLILFVNSLCIVIEC